MSVTASLLLLGAAILVLRWLQNRRNPLWKLPTFPGLPIIGHLHLVAQSSADIFKNLLHTVKYDTCGILRVDVGPAHNVVILTRAETAQALLGSKEITKSWHYDFFRPWARNGLFLSTGAKWHHMRRLLNPAFHFRGLDKHVHIVVEHTGNLIRLLQAKPTDEEFDIVPLLQLLTMDIHYDSINGTKSSFLNGQPEKVISLQRVLDLTFHRLTHAWLWPDWVIKYTQTGKEFNHHTNIIDSLSRQLIADRRARMEKNNIRSSVIANGHDEDSKEAHKKLCTLDMLISEAKDDDEEILGNVLSFDIAAMDSTAVTVGWTLFLVGHHTDVYEKLQEEADAVYENGPDGITLSTIADLKYTGQVIKESQRLYPVFPIVARKLEHDLDIDGYRVPAGTDVAAMILNIHRDPRFYPDPTKFDPDRFTPEASSGRHPYAFIPFSAGPRNCIGQKQATMTAKAIVACIIHHFRVKVVQRLDEVQPKLGITLTPANGIRIKLSPRTKLP